MSKNQFDIFVVRHGRSEGQDDLNKYKTIGDHNLSLVDWGYAQSYAAADLLQHELDAENISLTSIFTSSCRRTRETAQSIQSGLKVPFVPVLEDARLDKQKFGIFDGLLSTQERLNSCPEEHLSFQQQVESLGSIRARPALGESIADVYDRATAFLDDAAAYGGTHIVVTHGLIALSIEKRLMNLSDEWLLQNADTVKNCEIRRFTARNGAIEKRQVCFDPLENQMAGLG